MTHCYCAFITVAHIHINRILTFSRISEYVLWFFCLTPCIPTIAQCQLSPSTPGVCDLSLSCVGLKMAPTVISFLQEGVVFSRFTSPRSCRERPRLNLNTVHFLFMDLCLSFSNGFCIIIIIICLENENLNVTNQKYTT